MPKEKGRIDSNIHKIMDFIKTYQEWLNSKFIDEETKSELLKIKNKPKLIKEAFSKEIEFGTGGLRGIIGAGINRINKWTIRKATQGIANYLNKIYQNNSQISVVIAYDTRKYSKKFAEETAAVFIGNNIKVFLFDYYTPTPILSFFVRELKAIAGIVITASHNPPEYNGYKVYWSDGGQIVPELAKKLIAEIKKIKNFSEIKITELKKNKLLKILPQSIIKKYINKIKKLSFIDKTYKVNNLKIVYTPLNGTGNLPVRTLLKEKGFKNILIVKEQELPDENFTTVKIPNPEEKEVFKKALQLARKTNADIILATDPDCDRIGVVVRNTKNKFVFLNGNNIGILLSEYILSKLKEKKRLPENGIIIKTVVTTDMIKEIAKNYGVKIIETLTGFKYIGEKIKEFEKNKKYNFIFGFEESYGYLFGNYVRDKDAVQAAMLICEISAYYKTQGLTLDEQLLNLMKKYGFYAEELYSFNLPGLSGLEKIKKIMENLRKSKKIFNDIIFIEDYSESKKYDLLKNKELKINLPITDMLRFILKEDISFTVRPSGTEPKLKIYFSSKGSTKEEAEKKLSEIKTRVIKYLKNLLM